MNINPEALYDEGETAAFYRCAVSTLQKRRVHGDGVPFVKIGRLVRYRGRDIIEDIEFRVRSSTSDTGQKAA